MATFLNRKIFLTEGNGGGGDLNVNGALGLTTGTAGEALLENDLIFKSPDITTDYYPIEVPDGTNIPNSYVPVEVNGTKYIVITTDPDTLDSTATMYKFDDGLNQWISVLTTESATRCDSVEVYNNQIILVTTRGGGGMTNTTDYPTSQYRFEVRIFDPATETATVYQQSISGDYEMWYRGKYFSSETLIINNIMYITHYLAEMNLGTAGQNASGSGDAVACYSFDLTNPGTFTLEGSIRNSYNLIFSGSSDTGTTHYVKMVEDNGQPLFFFSEFIYSNGSTSYKLSYGFLTGSGGFVQNSNNFFDQNGSAVDAAGIWLDNIEMFNLNGFTYLIRQDSTALYVYKRGAGEPNFTGIDTGGANSNFVTVADFGFNTAFNTSRRSKIFVLNGVIYAITLLTSSPFFCVLALIDDEWILLPQPQQSPFAQSYADNNYPAFNVNNVFVDGDKVLFATKHNGNSPYAWIWESTENGTFTFEWVKNQQSFADAIGIAQEDAASDASFSVYQMTPGS